MTSVHLQAYKQNKYFSLISLTLISCCLKQYIVVYGCETSMSTDVSIVVYRQLPLNTGLIAHGRRQRRPFIGNRCII